MSPKEPQELVSSQLKPIKRAHFDLVGVQTGPSKIPKLCKIMAFMAVAMGLGPLFCILLGVQVGFMGVDPKPSTRNLTGVSLD